MFRHYMEYLLGDEKNFELSYRVFHFYCFLGLTVSLLSAVSAFYLKLLNTMINFMLIYAVFVSCCWYLSRFKRLFGLSTFLAITVLVFVITPGLWILNSGSTGGAQYFFIFWGVMICTIYRGRARTTWLIALFAVIGILMYIEYTYPAMILTYNSRPARYFDVYTSSIVAMLSTTLIFIVYANSYQEEHEYVKKYTEHLELLAITDGLTGLYNQSHLHSCLKYEICKAERYNHCLSLIMIDTDYFKQVNDSFGHPTGNLVLSQFVNILRLNTRTSDIVGRYGGDEFLIICPETNLQGAVSITEKLRSIVEAASFGEFQEIRLTISCGVTTWNGEDAGQLIEAVDKALYTAKRAGRNRVEIYGDKTPAENQAPDTDSKA